MVPNSERLVAAIALWFRLHLQSCGPGFESQDTIYTFSICIVEIEICCWKEKKERKFAGIWPYFTKLRTFKRRS